MNREKKFVRLLITNTVILLMPVIAIGVLMIFLFLGKLEREFEELNSKTMETANVRVDMLMEGMLSVYYHLSNDADVHTFLLREFESTQERVSLLTNIKKKITDSLINMDGIANVVFYSNVNDVFIGNETVFGRQEYYERYFKQSNYEYEELFAILEDARTIPAWLVTDEYLIYCSDAKASDRSDKGRYLAAVKKQKVLDTLSEVCGNLEIGYAVVYRGKEILMQTEDFNMEAYEADVQQDDTEYRYKNYLIKTFSSKKTGGLKYVYTIDYEKLGGNIAQMIRSLVLIICVVLGVSAIFAKKKMKSIHDMYLNVLKENAGLENHLSIQVEKLNRQLLMNALCGYDFLSPEKQHIYLKSSKLRVLIFRFVERQGLEGETIEENDVRDVVSNCLETEWTEYLFLYEKDIGYICVLGYETQEKMNQVMKKLQKTLAQNCGTSIYAGLSTEIHDITKLSNAYEWAGAALHYCITLYEDGGLVEYDDIMELEKGKIYYPAEKEKQLLRSVRMGMREDAENCLKHIRQMNFEERRLSKGALRQLLVRMLNTVYELIDMVYSGEQVKYDDFGRVSRNVLQADNVEYAFEMIQSIALSICEKCSVRKEGELRKQIIVYINENFKDQDLSLEKMATDFEMSYYHLSRLFNESMQMNFTTYLTGVRLEYSRELLCATTLSVEQVATQSGFLQSGSFIRAFKKYYGATPGKYREERLKDIKK